MTDITELAQLKPGKYAILYRDNWDGEKNEYHTLAVLTEEGGWYDDEFNAELLKYRGDKILKVWPLDDGSNILALVDAQAKNALVAGGIEAATKLYERIAELESEVKFPGVMRCNTCGFSRSHVIVTPGGMRAGESAPERCPNGCSPLWHDTYRRQYNELYDAYKELESRAVTVKLPRPGFITISGERKAVYLKADVDAVLASAGIEVSK